jgi:hypothetical protein
MQVIYCFIPLNGVLVHHFAADGEKMHMQYMDCQDRSVVWFLGLASDSPGVV